MNDEIAQANKEELNLFGWDVVNASRFAAMNSAIVAQGKSPTTFQYSSASGSKTTLTGTWSPWKMVPGSSGSTLMMEMPVKTGAIGASMPTDGILDEATKDDGVTLSDDKLTASTTDLALKRAHTTTSHTKGRFYFEITNNVTAPSDTSTNEGKAFVGLAEDTENHRSPNSILYRSDGAILGDNAAPLKINTSNGNGAVWKTEGNTVGVAVDFDEGKVWFRGPDGAWLGEGADPRSGAGEAYSFTPGTALFATVALNKGNATFNLGQQPFKLADPDDPDSSGAPDRFLGRWPGVPGERDPVTLDGAVVTATITLTKLEAEEKKTKLMANTEMTEESTPVQVNSVSLADGSDADVVTKSAFEALLNENIAEFSHIFHIIDISEEAAKKADEKGMKWLQPTDFAYAATDLPGSDPTASIFGVLTQTENRSTDALSEQISPFLLEDMPDDSDAMVAISAERFAKKILLPGAISTVDGGTADDFVISNDSRTVTNKAEMPWRKITLPTDEPEVVTPIIPAGGLKLRVEGKKIIVAFENLKYQSKLMNPDAIEDCTVSFEQHLFLETKDAGDGNHILFTSFADPDDPDSTDKPTIRNMKTSMTMNPESIGDLELGLIIGAAALIALVLVGGAIKGLTMCCSSAEEADIALQENGMPATNELATQAAESGEYGPIQIAQGAPQVTEQYGQVPELAAGDNYGSVVDTFVVPSGEEVDVKSPARAAIDSKFIPGLSKWHLGYHLMSTAAGSSDPTVIGLDSDCLDAMAKDDFTKSNISATIQSFLNEALTPFQWPETDGWDFHSVGLNGALLLYGKLKETKA